MSRGYLVGYTFGIFDIFHIEHLDHLKQAKSHCDHLVVGVLTDDVVEELTGTPPVNPYEERLQIVRSLDPADSVIGQLTLDFLEVWRQVQFDALLIAPETIPEDEIDLSLRDAVETRTLPKVRRSLSGLVERSDG